MDLKLIATLVKQFSVEKAVVFLKVKQDVDHLYSEIRKEKQEYESSINELNKRIRLIQSQCEHPATKVIPSAQYEPSVEYCRVCGKEL